MAMATCTIGLGPYQKVRSFEVSCRKRDRERENDKSHPYKVIEITPPPKSLGVRCFPPNLQCGESVTIEGHTYTISAVTHRYQLRKGKYEPDERRLDVLSTVLYNQKPALEGYLLIQRGEETPTCSTCKKGKVLFTVGPQELIFEYNGTTIS